MHDGQEVNEQFAALADYLFARRNAILENWRHAVADDPDLTTASTLIRREFYDHIPAVLETFEEVLRAHYLAQKAQAGEEQKARAAEHGQHRWHRGYKQQDVMREWAHLHLCLVNELESYTAMNRAIDDSVMPVARRALVQLCSNGVTESAMRFAELQQIEATGRIRDLEQALEEIKVLEQSRGETWRRALHDVRGNFGVIKNISDQLQDEETEEALKAEFVLLLQKSVGSLHTLLNNLLVLSKLDAGQEQRNLQELDAASVLRTLCDSFQPFALARGLFLHARGPASLPVQGDTINIQRIAQNLILNALKYTGKGGVTVVWEALETEGVQRWAFSVEDTGPGFQSSSEAPLAHAIEESTLEAAAVEQSPNELAPPTDASENIFQPAPLFSRRSVPQSQGEGVGLSIVKRLCELLDATLELKTEPGQGSVFRVVLPRSYDPD
jgi:signal transduction histidine kinase